MYRTVELKNCMSEDLYILKNKIEIELIPLSTS